MIHVPVELSTVRQHRLRTTYAGYEEAEVVVEEQAPCGRLSVVVHSVVWGERRPAHDRSGERRAERQQRRWRSGRGIRQWRLPELCSSDGQHDDEGDHVWDPDDQLIPGAWSAFDLLHESYLDLPM